MLQDANSILFLWSKYLTKKIDIKRARKINVKK